MRTVLNHGVFGYRLEKKNNENPSPTYRTTIDDGFPD